MLKSNLSPAHFLRLKTAWRKAFKTITFGHDDSDIEANNMKEIRSLHDKNFSLSPDVLDDRKEAANVMKDYLRVKELQEHGWKYDKPAFREILTAKAPPTQRQKQAVYRQQQKRLTALT